MMRKSIFSILTLSLFFSAVCAADPTGACYITYQLKQRPEVILCYDNYTAMACANELKRTNVELSYEFKGVPGIWRSDRTWYEGLRCRK